MGRSLSSGDNIRCLDGQRADFTVRWHLVGDRRAGDEPEIKIDQRALMKIEESYDFLECTAVLDEEHVATVVFAIFS